MRYLFIISALLLITHNTWAQAPKTDVSLFMRSDSTKYLSEVSEKTGDLYKTIGHHGPAVENQWLALRMYFDHKAAIDVYNKAKPGLELKQARWYPTPEQQKDGWGADYYKVGSTVGLGGIRLWDGEKVIKLDPVSMRTARVKRETNSAYMEMLSEGVNYKDTQVDILVRVTVYSNCREAKVEAFSLSDIPVQFVTGVNYHSNHWQQIGVGYIAAWGLHPEDVAAETISLGAAIIYNPKDFLDRIDDGKQHLLISKPTKMLQTRITSACEREIEINTFEKFVEYLEKL
ncbi:MAG TPA: DUF4861 family protein [Prolixibacteraceae bacterium]|nr:DUF4861 family protein [Prolixibacteraceae bacterium]